MSECEQNKILLNEIEERKENLVIFAGAGIPTSTGIPAWTKLLKDLAKELNDTNLEESISEETNHPEKAQEIYEAFISKENGDVKEGEQKYYSKIKELLVAKDWDFSPSQLSMWHTCKKIVTTNFDRTFNNAHEDYYRFRDEDECFLNTQCHPDLDYQHVVKNEQCLVYLHGNTARKMIFKKDDYEKFYNKSDSLGSFYRELYLYHTLLFIGFSFNDEYILEMFKSLHSKLSNHDRMCSEHDDEYSPILKSKRHYVFIKDESFGCEQVIELLEKKPVATSKEEEEKEIEIQKYKNKKEDFEKLCIDLKNIKIMPIKYKNHKDYRHWLNEIAAYKPKTVSDIGEDPNSDSGFMRLN